MLAEVYSHTPSKQDEVSCYTKITQQDVQQALETFDNDGHARNPAVPGFGEEDLSGGGT
jgi:hypothetical protein